MKEKEVINQEKNNKNETHITMRTGAILSQGAAQIGCLTMVVILVGLGAGLLMDRWLDTSPWFTLALVLASVPLSLFATVRVALSTAKQATSSQDEESLEGDDE